MNEEQAIKVLIQVAELAQSKGVLSLNGAVVVAQAITILSPAKQGEVDPANKKTK